MLMVGGAVVVSVPLPCTLGLLLDVPVTVVVSLVALQPTVTLTTIFTDPPLDRLPVSGVVSESVSERA